MYLFNTTSLSYGCQNNTQTKSFFTFKNALLCIYLTPPLWAMAAKTIHKLKASVLEIKLVTTNNSTSLTYLVLKVGWQIKTKNTHTERNAAKKVLWHNFFSSRSLRWWRTFKSYWIPSWLNSSASLGYSAVFAVVLHPRRHQARYISSS